MKETLKQKYGISSNKFTIGKGKTVWSIWEVRECEYFGLKVEAQTKNGAWRKFSEKEVLMIRRFHKKCKSYKKTMEKFNISSKGTLHRTLNREYVKSGSNNYRLTSI